jgi:dTDP-4-amino-4,6-dideoxygalactose transaminase
MPTQLNGRTCAMDPILDMAEKNGLFLVEDAAQALGSKYKGKSAGTFGLASDISFFPAKVLGCLGDAGAVLVNDKELFQQIYQIHDHGRDRDDGQVKRWGRNSRLDNIQAAILNHKLTGYGEVIERRREVASIYHDRLSGLDELQLPAPPDSDPDHFDVYQNYEITASRRDELKVFLGSKGVGTLIQWGGTAIHHFRNLGFTQECPRTDEFFDSCIMLPMNIFISNEDVQYVCDQIYSFYRA